MGCLAIHGLTTYYQHRIVVRHRHFISEGETMTLTELVPSLDLCQQLKAAGFPQFTALAWYPTREVGAVSVAVWVVDAMSSDMLCAAPMAGELEEWLRTKYPDATISSFRREGFGMDVDIDDDVLNYHEGVGQYPTHVSALAALVLEVAG